jgi:transcriptional regulator with XRE-family HTH domain
MVICLFLAGGLCPLRCTTIRTARTDDQAKNALYANFFLLILRRMEHLQTYLKTHKAKPLAEAVGISQSYLSDMKKGNRSPSLRVAVAIEDATEGAVPVRAWVSK